ncbi:MAG: Poly-gamma-glutamate biosynthesis protein [Acidimicrobiales bacterium]|nr:Poly-gamma-glutamate biosynthesis protein [Acidimicrobiales bacterium]
MHARGFAVLGVGGLLMVVVASCARPDSVPGTESAAPDTVLLSSSQPEFLDAMSNAIAPRVADGRSSGVVLVPERVVVRSEVPAPTMPSVPPPTPASTPVMIQPLAAVLRHASFDFTGDTLLHSPLVQQAARNAGGDGFDFSQMYAEVTPVLSAADYSICHLESPIAPPGAALTTFPAYGVPAEIATALAGAGYDRCSTASNHTLDRGTAGVDATVDATVDALEAAGVSEAGMARTPEEALVSLVDVGGIAVAHLSYTFGFNGAHLPADEPWRSNLIDVDKIIWAAADARARGADVVILSLHWGSEGSAAITPFQRQVADAITRAGVVDLIVGHHVHVIQPIEQVNGTWVVFGMGNFLSNMPTGSFPAKSQDGEIVSVSIDEQLDGTFAVSRPLVIPTWVDRGNGFLIRPVVADLADPTVDRATKDQLYTSLQRTGSVVGAFVVSS